MRLLAKGLGKIQPSESAVPGLAAVRKLLVDFSTLGQARQPGAGDRDRGRDRPHVSGVGF
jgi:hypothetical protein